MSVDLFSLLASEAMFCVFQDVVVDTGPVIRRGEPDVCFEGGIVIHTLMVIGLAQSQFAVLFQKVNYYPWIFVVIEPDPDNFGSILIKFGCWVLEIISF